MSTRDHPDWWRPVGGSNSQDSVLERRSTIWNNGAIPFWASRVGVNRYGKFFPRGMRGHLHVIDVYCRDAAAAGGTITVYITPCIGMGPLYPANIVVPVGGAAAWRAATFNVMWNYDSMFIWVLCSVAAVEFAFDAGTPYDGHDSVDSGVTWVAHNNRPWFVVYLMAETPGDVPISGIINNIRIPNTSSLQTHGAKVLAIGVPSNLVTVQGAGYDDLLVIYVDAAANSHLTEFLVYCDNVLAYHLHFSDLNVFGCTANTPTLSLTTYAANGFCAAILTKMFEFRREFRVEALNGAGIVTAATYIFPTLLR